MKAPHWDEVMAYAKATAADDGICELTRLSCQRFLDDLNDPRFRLDPALPEYCIEVITRLFCFNKGERINGTPLRGKHFEMQPWQLMCTYAICGFVWADSGNRRFTEANVFAPRKTVKTSWAESLLFALCRWYRKSGAAEKTVAGSLKQGLEGFDFLKYNLCHLGLCAPGNPEGYPLRMFDSSLGHRFVGDIGRDGYLDMETLAYKPDLFDAFNAMFVHLDELELYKNAIPYTRLRDSMKPYTNGLLLITFTAGDDGTGFAATHRNDLEAILRKTVKGPDADRTFAFMADARRAGEFDVDFTDPAVFKNTAVHRAANPGYGITIRPNDMLAAALQAERNPTLRKEFLTRSLNIFVSSFKAWFDVEEFRRSDSHYDWTQKELSRMVKHWYGGADLSKLHDLTAAAIVGEIPAAKAATEHWTPTEDVLVIISHAWFPITAASEKADQDHIPLFGWKDDRWLDMPNEASMDPTEPVKQFKKWRDGGFAIRKVGHDRKFARKYYTAMKQAGFSVIDQPQLYLQKSEGFRYIEHKAKVGCLYYCHAEPFEYCIGNVRAQEKVDDAVQYEKIDPNSRIDVFDAAVFGTVRLLIDSDKMSQAAKWFEGNENA